MRIAIIGARMFITAALFAVGGHSSRPVLSALDQIDPFDYYGKISWEDEKARLDNFAVELQDEPNLIAYIIVYAGRHACAGEAQSHARRVKEYLVKTRHVEANRMRSIDGGYQEKFRVVLQPMPRWAAAVLTPAPTLKPSDVIVKNCKPKSTKRKKRGS